MKKFTAWFLTLALLFPFFPSAQASTTYTYAVQGGNLMFDPTTGTITDCDHSVTRADIPSEIYGIPVREIKNSAFNECTRLVSVTIPKSVTRIGKQAFRMCSSLQSVTIPDSVTEFGQSVFSMCSKLTNVTLPGSISTIPHHTFYECKSLINVSLGEGISEVCNQAFYKCNSLKEVVFPNSVKTFDAVAFGSCKELKSVTIGKSCNFIARYAFSLCPKMSSLYFRGDAPGTSGKIMNQFASDFIVYYPEGASGWTTPTWNGYITKSYSLTPVQPDQPTQPVQPTQPTTPQPALVTAVPTASNVYVNGTKVAFDAYNIGGNNYFKLRDLAFVLSGSEAQFEVGWNSAANSIQLTTRLPYTPVGGEMASGGKINKIGQQTSSSVFLNGALASFTAYNIDGNNYFKLRDIGQAINFSVEWNAAQNSIEIDTSLPYRAE